MNELNRLREQLFRTSTLPVCARPITQALFGGHPKIPGLLVWNSPIETDESRGSGQEIGSQFVRSGRQSQPGCTGDDFKAAIGLFIHGMDNRPEGEVEVTGAGELAGAQPHDMRTCLEPNTSSLTRREAPDFRFRQAVGPGQPMKAMIAITHQPVGGADPQRAVLVFSERIDRVVHQFRCVVFIEHSEAHPIKPRHACPGADP